jgi:hypothetical protein
MIFTIGFGLMILGMLFLGWSLFRKEDLNPSWRFWVGAVLIIIGLSMYLGSVLVMALRVMP